MQKEFVSQFFDEMGGTVYDQTNSFFKPVHDNLHFLNSLILKNLPNQARILCVGVGTGADIFELAKSNKTWRFVGVDPAQSMLKRCEDKLREKGLNERCELFHGYLSDYKSDQRFDAVLCLYVMHFIKDKQDRARMFLDFSKFLNKDGYLIITEISTNTKSPVFNQQIENWKALHALTGTSQEKLDNLPNVIGEQLGVQSPEATEKMILENGFKPPVSFFQSFLIRGWYSRKT